jgi:D-sedoheptulose 7-phosphate isomerase
MTFNFASNLQEHQLLFQNLAILEPAVIEASELITKSFSSGGKLMLCGNGGSAADSQHIAAEMTGRFIKDRKPLPAIALTTDTSALTCIANDYSFEDVFARQISALGRLGDVLIAISTSGNSGNVIKAMHVANELSIKVIALTGRDGGRMKALADHSIIVPSNTTARIQEAHIFIGHMICGSVEIQLGLVG